MAIVRQYVEEFARHQLIEGPRAGATAISPTHGSIQLVGSRGQERWATYRLIYLTNPWVWAAVNKKSADLARLPLHVFGFDAEGERDRIRGDVPLAPGRPAGGAALDRLLLRPDDRMSRFAFWNGTFVDRFVYGNALSELQRAGGMPVRLRRQRWRNVNRVEERDEDILWYEVGRDRFGRPRRLVPDDVIHFGRGTDPEGPLGVSPLASCRYTIALHDAVVRHLVAFFENWARPSGHVKVDNLNREKARLIRELLAEAHASPENAGKVLVTSGDWKNTSETPEASQVVELLKLSREEVATTYGMPPPVLGILDRAIKSNVKEMREQYVREGLGPSANEAEDELTAQLLPLAPSWRYLFVEYQLAEQLRPDLEARSQVYQRMKHMQSIDEQRKAENLRPFKIKGVTDVPWMDSGAAPVTAFSPNAMAKEIAAELAKVQPGGSDSAASSEAEKSAPNGHKDVDTLEVQ